MFFILLKYYSVFWDELNERGNSSRNLEKLIYLNVQVNGPPLVSEITPKKTGGGPLTCKFFKIFLTVFLKNQRESKILTKKIKNDG